ncbi:MAG TPA: dTDP-4-dehydrorhamnose 3,5-epimerase [Steroidobacteraceae bacterium]|nr:dTDP-4-dehydrorhamnose 3,5-epimerase [Steroidobacteraceae bacterium]
MKFLPTEIPDVVLIEPRVFADDRGFFMETWQLEKFFAAGIKANFVQGNHSASKQWVLRGLHYQIQQPQGKLVRAIVGEVFDAVVDLRRSSKHFKKTVSAVLSANNRRMLWVPPGFAHGFLVTSEHAEVSYYCTDYYAPQFERSVAWNDPTLGIAWPIPTGVRPILNDKDAAAPRLSDAETFA